MQEPSRFSVITADDLDMASSGGGSSASIEFDEEEILQVRSCFLAS
jgi:hypothetical protein